MVAPQPIRPSFATKTPDYSSQDRREPLEESPGTPSETSLPATVVERPLEASVGGPHEPDRHRGLRLGLRLLRIGPLLILVLLVIALSLLSPFFFTTRNLGNVMAATAAIAVLSMGQLLVILTRGIDLSVGSTLALASVVGALVFTNVDSGLVVIAAMLATGLLVGTVNGVVYVRGRLPHPFVITLAMLSIARGLALWLSGGQPIRGMPPVVNAIGGESIGWFPVSAILVLAIAFLVFILTTRIVWGRWIYSVGGNPEAARRTGIPVNKVLISVYIVSGLMAGVAGIITAGRLNAGSPTFGELAELDSIAAVVIGGASFLGGRGNVLNALVGALMIGVIRNGMNLLAVDAFFQLIVIGVVIILAVEADVLRGYLEDRFRVVEAARS
jgi:ribose transport system permease protein